jgi:hypothetical protein
MEPFTSFGGSPLLVALVAPPAGEGDFGELAGCEPGFCEAEFFEGGLLLTLSEGFVTGAEFSGFAFGAEAGASGASRWLLSFLE